MKKSSNVNINRRHAIQSGALALAGIAAAPALAGQAVADTPNKEVVRRHLIDFWQNGDFSIIDEIFDPEFIDHNPMPGQPTGPAGIKMAAEAVKLAFPNHRYDLIHLIEHGDLVIDHWQITAVHEGPFFGKPATGKTVVFDGIDILRIKNGRIAEIWHVEELFQLMSQVAGEQAA